MTSPLGVPPISHRSDVLGRYYTQRTVGRLLVSQLGKVSPKCIVDLGVGRGSLSLAALDAFEYANLLTVDIDPISNRHLKSALSNFAASRHQHLRADVLSAGLPRMVRRSRAVVDAAICNPPFALPEWRRGFARILDEAGFNACLPSVKDANSAILFLAQNLRVLDDGGTIGIILPDSLISSTRYRAFREELLTRHRVLRAIRLPRGSFKRTDALAHIVVLQKGQGATDSVHLQELTAAGDISDGMIVSPTTAAERLDLGFHAFSTQRFFAQPARTQPLAALVVKCTRGSYTSSQVKAMSPEVLHTSDISLQDKGKWRRLGEFKRRTQGLATKGVRARRGDILVARVGRGLEERLIGVHSGSPLISDCVFLVRVKPCDQRRVLSALTSERGRAWLASRAYGVSAKQITKKDLMSFPVETS